MLRHSTWIQGILLFLFIPLVLMLFLGQPMGPAASLTIGLVVMLGHRQVAAPWVRRHAAGRCAWCAGPAGARAVPLEVAGARGNWHLVACSEAHAGRTRRFLSTLRRWRVPITAGIFAPLLLLLAGTLALALGHGFLPHAENVRQFRLVVAATVVLASLAYPWVRRPDEALSCPFPLHNLLLLGIRQTLWVFRLVGAWWILDAAWRWLG